MMNESGVDDWPMEVQTVLTESNHQDKKVKITKQEHVQEKPQSQPKALWKFQCDVCRKKFLRKHTLAIHMRLHSDDCELFCSICLKSFTESRAFNDHMRTHNVPPHKRNFKCAECKKTFARKSFLNMHLRLHPMRPGEDLPKKSFPRRRFQCGQCNKNYCTQAGLQQHSPIHHQEQEWECLFCPKTFLTIRTVQEHMHAAHPPTSSLFRHCNSPTDVDVDFSLFFISSSEDETTSSDESE